MQHCASPRAAGCGPARPMNTCVSGVLVPGALADQRVFRRQSSVGLDLQSGARAYDAGAGAAASAHHLQRLLCSDGRLLLRLHLCHLLMPDLHADQRGAVSVQHRDRHPEPGPALAHRSSSDRRLPHHVCALRMTLCALRPCAAGVQAAVILRPLVQVPAGLARRDGGSSRQPKTASCWCTVPIAVASAR